MTQEISIELNFFIWGMFLTILGIVALTVIRWMDRSYQKKHPHSHTPHKKAS